MPTGPPLFPRYVWSLIIFASGVFILIQVINILHSSTKTVKSANINFPFVISLEPPVMNEGSTVNISLNTTRPETVNSSLSLLVIYPDARYFEIKDPIVGNHQFPPQNSKETSNLPKGKYTVALIDKIKNRNIMSVSFNVTSTEWYDQTYEFLQVGSLAAFIPFLIPVGGFTYSYLSRRWEEKTRRVEQEIADKRKKLAEAISDRNRILQEKSKWILSNIKTLMNLIGRSTDCVSCFSVKKVKDNTYSSSIKNDDVASVHFWSIKFLQAKDDFEKNVNIWYFDDAKAEFFLILLWEEIFSIYSIVCPLDKLQSFYGKKLDELKQDSGFGEIQSL